MRKLARIAAGLTAGFVLSGAPAQAAVYAPPGKAGASEYSETIPTSGGNVTPPNRTVFTPTSGSSTNVGPIAKLGAGAKGLRSDAKLGTTGQLAAGFAESTAPVRVRPQITPTVAGGTANGSPSAPANSAGAAAGPRPAAPAGSAFDGILSVVAGSDGGGIGVLLPLTLVFALGLACGVVLKGVRRRA